MKSVQMRRFFLVGIFRSVLLHDRFLNTLKRLEILEMYSRLYKTSEMEIFVKIINGWKLFAKNASLDIW